jgi:PAS domain S-box-containing protein
MPINHSKPTIAYRRTGRWGVKLRIRDFIHLNYESQIRISLIFFILFLILLNFGTEFLLHKTKSHLKQQTQQQLSATALSASLIWEKNPHRALRKDLLELSFQSGINRITFLSLDGQPLISSKEIRSTGELHIFNGIKPELVKDLKVKGEKPRSGELFSDLYSDESGTSYLSYYLPLESEKTDSRIWVMVEKDATAFAGIEKLSRFNAMARLVGLFIAALAALVLIKSMLRPYRLMVKKAAKEKIFPVMEMGKPDGELDVAVGIFEQVIKELKQKEGTLKKLYRETDRKAKNLESYNEYILRSMTSGMIICDEKGKITRMNRPAEEILGRSEVLVLGKHYNTIFEKERLLCSAIQTSLSEEITLYLTEVAITKPNGESVPISLTSSAVKDEQDKMLGAVVFLTDLSEIKKLEGEIAFKDKMAALGEMSSGLAHELRNSMGAVLGFCKLLSRREADPAVQDQVIDGIVNEAMAMESMLQRFLSFARPFQPRMEKTDVKEVIQECHRSVKEILQEKGITFEFDSEPNLPPPLGDRLLLKQCFQNLIQNSIQAMPKGGKLGIRLSLEQLPSDDDLVLVEITDTGCGIAKEDQNKVFNPFFTSREKGTGLGLSLVKKIISLHNGRIEFESEPDRGTTFRIHLPLKPEVKPTSIGSVEREELEPVIFSHPINVEDGNNVEPEM